MQEALVQVLARYPRFEGLVSPLAYTKTALARLAYRSWRAPELPSEVPNSLAGAHGEAFTEDVVLRRIVLAALDELPSASGPVSICGSSRASLIRRSAPCSVVAPRQSGARRVGP